MLVFNTANLIGGMIFGSIGFIAFTYGKRMHLWKPMFYGLGLMVFPYFVENAVLLTVLGSLATLGIFFLRD
jgi:hypothetical protein